MNMTIKSGGRIAHFTGKYLTNPQGFGTPIYSTDPARIMKPMDMFKPSLVSRDQALERSLGGMSARRMSDHSIDVQNADPKSAHNQPVTMFQKARRWARRIFKG
jgi:hypothetical protein